MDDRIGFLPSMAVKISPTHIPILWATAPATKPIILGRPSPGVGSIYKAKKFKIQFVVT